MTAIRESGPDHVAKLKKRGDKIAVPGDKKGSMVEYEHLGEIKRGKISGSGVIVRRK